MKESDAMLPDEGPWDAQELSEIIQQIPIDYAAQYNFLVEKAELQEGPCFSLNDFCAPFRWIDKETEINSTHVAVSEANVMYLVEKYPKHVYVGCPPCSCCCESSYREDYSPKVRKLIPIEKITDIEVHEAGSNELVVPCCACTPVSLEIPISKALVNTAGSHGPEVIIDGVEDASAFRRLVMDLKKGGINRPPAQQGMPSASSLGATSEMVSLLKDIANTNRQIVQILQK